MYACFLWLSTKHKKKGIKPNLSNANQCTSTYTTRIKNYYIRFDKSLSSSGGSSKYVQEVRNIYVFKTGFQNVEVHSHGL
jgi:hypothetical protein